jgi:hypothetical protein
MWIVIEDWPHIDKTWSRINDNIIAYAERCIDGVFGLDALIHAWAIPQYQETLLFLIY